MVAWFRTSADFLLSEWLWNITYALYLIPLSLIIMFFLLKWVEQINAIRALLISLSAHLFSMTVFSGLVVLILIFLMRLEYTPTEEAYTADACNKLNATLYLGFIHAILQTFFFLLVRRRLDLHFIRVATLAFVSMGIATLLVYLLLPTF